jgi:hypothetical protein
VIIVVDQVNLNSLQDESSIDAKAFIEVAAGMDDTQFATSNNAAVRKEVAMADKDGVVLFKKFDEGLIFFNCS